MEESEKNDLIERFEYNLDNNYMTFFDSEEFEEIILYYLDMYDLEYAEKAILEAYKQHPYNLDLKIRELEYQLADNQLKKAYQLIDELNNYQIQNLDFYLCQAQYWSLRKFHKKAIYFYNLSLQFEEEQDFIYNNIGNEYFEINNYEYALINFKKALEFYPEDEFALFSIIDCYSLLHQNTKCIQFINEFIDKNPYNETAWFALGQLYLTQKNYIQAIYSFDYVVVINPKSIYGYTQKALCYEKLKRWEDAIECYNESLEYDDTPAYTYYKIGHANLKLKENIKSLKSFVKSVHADPQFDKSWFEIALFYENINNFDEALFFIKEAIHLDSENTLYIKKIAYFEIQLGKYEESAQYFKKLTELEPNHYNNWIAYIEILMALGEFNESKNIIIKTLKSFNNTELYFQLANCYFQMNFKEQGLLSLEKALKLNPKEFNNFLNKYPILKKYRHEL